jgi:uncharacterized protein YjbI with pentapeptide repeats
MRKKSTWSGRAEPPELPDEWAPPPADLSAPVDLEDAHVTDLDWTGTRAFSLSIERSRLERCRLTGSVFERAELVDCELVDCELSGVTFLALRASRVELRGCRMSGLVAMETSLHDVKIDSCRLDEATLRIKDGRYLVVEGCELTKADLQEAVLAEARFDDCNLTRADVTGARLTNVRLEGGAVEGLRGIRDLRGTTISQDLAVPLSLALLTQSGIVIDTDD